MVCPGAELNNLLVRTTVVSLALQTLVGRLVANGTLDKADLVAMRETGLQFAAGLRAHGGIGPQIGGARLDGEVAAWWEVADLLGGPRATGRDAGCGGR